MKDVVKHITETIAVIMINVFAWLAPLEYALKILVLLTTLVYTTLQIVSVAMSLNRRFKEKRK